MGTQAFIKKVRDRRGTQFLRECYSRDAWTAEATFSKLPETKWRQRHSIVYDKGLKLKMLALQTTAINFKLLNS